MSVSGGTKISPMLLRNGRMVSYKYPFSVFDCGSPIFPQCSLCFFHFYSEMNQTGRKYYSTQSDTSLCVLHNFLCGVLQQLGKVGLLPSGRFVELVFFCGLITDLCLGLSSSWQPEWEIVFVKGTARDCAIDFFLFFKQCVIRCVLSQRTALA